MKQHHESQWWQHWSCLPFFHSFLRYRFSQFIDVLCSLWEVCRATAAAPTYFPPAFVTSVDGKFQGTMIDGGAIQNNPVSLPWLIPNSDCFLIDWWHFEVQLGVFWKKKRKNIIMHPIQPHWYCITRTTSRNSTIHLPVCQSNHIQKTRLALVIHRRKSQDSNTRLTLYFTYFSNCFSCKMR